MRRTSFTDELIINIPGQHGPGAKCAICVASKGCRKALVDESAKLKKLLDLTAIKELVSKRW